MLFRSAPVPGWEVPAAAVHWHGARVAAGSGRVWLLEAGRLVPARSGHSDSVRRPIHPWSSCGDGDGDVPAIALANLPGPAPPRTAAALILLSCVLFLLHLFLPDAFWLAQWRIATMLLNERFEPALNSAKCQVSYLPVAAPNPANPTTGARHRNHGKVYRLRTLMPST